MVMLKRRSVRPDYSLPTKSRRGGEHADEKKPKGGVMALGMRDGPSSSQGHTTSKSCQSAGEEGVNTHAHTAQTLTHSLHLTRPALLSRGNSVHAYIPIPGLARLDDGKQAGCRCQKPWATSRRKSTSKTQQMHQCAALLALHSR